MNEKIEKEWRAHVGCGREIPESIEVRYIRALESERDALQAIVERMAESFCLKEYLFFDEDGDKKFARMYDGFVDLAVSPGGFGDTNKDAAIDLFREILKHEAAKEKA